MADAVIEAHLYAYRSADGAAPPVFPSNAASRRDSLMCALLTVFMLDAAARAVLIILETDVIRAIIRSRGLY